MIFIWIFAIALFGGVLLYLYNASGQVQARRKFLNDFSRGHKDCFTWQSSNRALWMALSALLVLAAGLWMLFQDMITPPLPYALVLMALAMLLLSVAVKAWYDSLILFYSQGFIWEEMIFPYRTIEIRDHQIISETAIPLSPRTARKVESEYEDWKKKREN